MKYYNVELLLSDAEKLQQLLYDMGVKFEISANGAYYHFEILLTPESKEHNRINKFLLRGAI